MSDVNFTVDPVELDQLAGSLGTIYTTFTQMPAHQPVDAIAIGNARLAMEFTSFLNGWRDGRKKIEQEIQIIARHVTYALEEYTTAEHSVTQAESNLAIGASGSVGLAGALTSAYNVLSGVVQGVGVTDPTLTPVQGIVPEVTAAAGGAHQADSTLQSDVTMQDPTLTPTTGLAEQVASAAQGAVQVDKVVDGDLGTGPQTDPGPVSGGPGGPGGPPQMIQLPVMPPSGSTTL